MKKTYINPEMVIVRMATQQMLADSTLGWGASTPPSNAEGREDDGEW